MCACEHEPYACTISYKSLTVLCMHFCAHLPPTITSSASGGEVCAGDIKYNLCVFSVLSSVNALHVVKTFSSVSYGGEVSSSEFKTWFLLFTDGPKQNRLPSTGNI